MNMSYRLNGLFIRKGNVRFIAAFLLPALAVVGLSMPVSACPPTSSPNQKSGTLTSSSFQLTFHNVAKPGDSYYTLTYNLNGQKQHLVCQKITSLQWADVPVQ